MSHEPAELKAHIKAEGEGLKENIEEIQNRVRGALDWHVWYKKNTAVSLGAVAAGGLILALLFPRRPSVASHYFDTGDMHDQMVEPQGPARRSSTPRQFSPLRQVADSTMSAVFGVAADKFQDLMADALPGFREHYNEAQRRRT
jgi:hypothetical protein